MATSEEPAKRATSNSEFEAPSEAQRVMGTRVAVKLLARALLALASSGRCSDRDLESLREIGARK